MIAFPVKLLAVSIVIILSLGFFITAAWFFLCLTES